MGEMMERRALTMLIEVLYEIRLALQSPGDLRSLHEAERALLALGNLVALHALDVQRFITIIRRN